MRHLVRLLLPSVMLSSVAAFAQAPDLAGMDLVQKSVPDGPVAKVCGANIEAEEFLALYKAALAQEQARISGGVVSDADRIPLALKCLGLLVEREVLYQEALKRELDISNEDLEKGLAIELDHVRKRVSGDQEKEVTEAELFELAGASREEALAELRKALLVEKMQAVLAKERGVTVSDETVAKVFKENKDMFRRPDLCHIKHIFVRAAARGGKEVDADRRRAREKAETALKRIRAGERFEAVAKSVSDEPFRENAGDLGPRPVGDAPGALPPFLSEAAYTLQPGQVSGVIESDFGYHVIQLVEITPGEELSFDKAKAAIRSKLLSDLADKASREFCRTVMAREGAVHIFLELEKTVSTHPNRSELLEVLAAHSREDTPESE